MRNLASPVGAYPFESLLVCPEKRSGLKLCNPQLIDSLNNLIFAGQVRNARGAIVKDPIEAGLVRKDEQLLYPIRWGVPLMHLEDAIVMGEGDYRPPPIQRKNYFVMRKEFDFWTEKSRTTEYFLTADPEREFFFFHLGFGKRFYRKKRILDLGCGPRGSLEWAENAALRIGLDPLALGYRQLGTDQHQMYYVSADLEHLPFPNNFFEVISSINALKNVRSIDLAVREITRVLAPKGWLLLHTEIQSPKTVYTPPAMTWEITERFSGFTAAKQGHFEKGDFTKLFDHSNSAKRIGWLLAQLQKN